MVRHSESFKNIYEKIPNGAVQGSAELFHGGTVDSKRILYTPSLFAKTGLIYLQEVGSLTVKEPHVSRRENLASYLFFMITSGSGVFKYEDTSYRLSAGDCVFIDCRKSYSHETSNDLWSLDWAHFDGINMRSIYNQYLDRGGKPCFRPVNCDEFTQSLKRLYEAASSDSNIRDMYIFEELTKLLTNIMEKNWDYSKKRKSKPKKQDLFKIKDYLDKNFTQKITLDDISDKFSINKFYLTRLFKEQFNVTINTYLLQLRITYAKRLLRFSDKSIEDIGIESGIGEAYYFSRVFKQVEGISPKDYRKEW